MYFFFIQNVALKRAAEALLPRGDTPPRREGIAKLRSASFVPSLSLTYLQIWRWEGGGRKRRERESFINLYLYKLIKRSF